MIFSSNLLGHNEHASMSPKDLGVGSMKALIFILFLIVCVPSSTHAQSRVLMGVMGDSLSAATFSNTKLDSPRSNFIRWEWPSIPGVIQNKDTLSWASGKEIQSHYMRLSSWFVKQGIELSVINAAVPGGSTPSLEDQVDDIIEEMKDGSYDELAYVTLLIGGNDACDAGKENEISDTEFGAILHRVWVKLSTIQQLHPIKILVSSIPKIPDVGLQSVQESTTWMGLSCKQMRKLISYCSSLTQWETKTGYNQNISIIARKNEVLKQNVVLAKLLYPKLDISYSPTLFENLQIAPELLAFDCFHLSTVGQEKFSSLLWQAQPWFK